jgi:conjugative relaxase-like TrwC/TraI family protein
LAATASAIAQPSGVKPQPFSVIAKTSGVKAFAPSVVILAPAIAAYHSREENYYYHQASELEKLCSDNKIKIQGIEPQEYIQVNGQLCEKLGLQVGENISEEVFGNLLNGCDKNGKEMFYIKHKVHGIDLTFSAPKSVSIQALVFKDNRVVSAHDQAVLSTMEEIEITHAYTRQMTNGKRENIQTGKICYVSARDGFSREHDPHLHTHCVVMNMTEQDGIMESLDMKKIFRGDFNKTFGAIYRRKLAHNLKKLGYNLTYTRNGEFKLSIIPKELEETFSKRHRQIEDAKKIIKVLI